MESPFFGGEGEIRTPEALASLPVFKTGAFNRSATSPFQWDQPVAFNSTSPAGESRAPLTWVGKVHEQGPLALPSRSTSVRRN
jgi:hypothetical protein